MHWSVLLCSGLCGGAVDCGVVQCSTWNRVVRSGMASSEIMSSLLFLCLAMENLWDTCGHSVEPLFS